MAGSVNKVILVGNLGRDPEAKAFQDGSRVVNLSVATSESWKDKHSGERKERTEWHRVVIYNDRIGEIAERYLRKGSKVYLEGALQTRKWTGQDGVEKYTTEVVMPKFRGELTMLSGGDREDRPSNGNGEATGFKPSNSAAAQYHAPLSPQGVDPSGPPADFDDEIPF